MKKIVLITGASSGIGEAIARELADSFALIICGRRIDKLEELKTELSGTEVQILQFDVRRNKEVQAAINALPEDWKKIDVLINNAGNAHGLNPIHEGDIADWDAMIDSNLKGLLYVTRAISPGMVQRKSGHIINISSIAGKQVYPGGNVYCASKFAVGAATDGIRLDLNPYNIKVTCINPGMVKTEFSTVRFKGDINRAENVYKGVDPLVAKDIAEVVKFTVDRPAHVVLSDITIMPIAQASAGVVNRKG
ncbi:MAG: SDR family NAD(P)-dependent oxidoreductase [Cyclobacteriaceae bacterium]|jgi:3-hydroxy acid dehydrogenase / malonic semialdehyde reductase|nr:SDR family NAD(P)-dependent oxidoreductase [Cyclobacteriaceae bacterium]